MSDQGLLSRRSILLGGAAASAAAAGPSLALDAAPSLKGKTILITGSSSGFGRLGAEHYARLGARVFASMRRTPRPEAEALRALAKKDALAIDIVDIDVTSDDSVEAGVAAVLEKAEGRLDALINNAGVGITGPVEVQDIEATRLAFETNVFGSHRMVRAVLPAMRAAKSGLIVAISSQLGRLIAPGAGHYCATKFALEAMSEQLAYELGPHGVEVAIIQPGGYPTKIWVNRNVYTGALKARTPQERLDAYPALSAAMGQESGGGRDTDPMDVPRAIAEIIASPAGRRPLRRAVHPTFRPQEAINDSSRQAQLGFLGQTPFGPWVKAALD